MKNTIPLTKKKIAVVFGRESVGLSNAELEKCDFLCHIPTSNEYPIMNLSHAVSIVLYELSYPFEKKHARNEIADREQLSALQNLFKVVIKKIDYTEDKKKTVYTCLKNIFGRSILSQKEVSILMGLFKKIKKCIKQ